MTMLGAYLRATPHAESDIAESDLVLSLEPYLIDRFDVGIANHLHQILVCAAQRDPPVQGDKEVVLWVAASVEFGRIASVILPRGGHDPVLDKVQLDPFLWPERLAEKGNISVGDLLGLVIHQGNGY